MKNATCYHCGKIIKGKYIGTNPPLHVIRLGIDFPKSFHPACYQKTEAKAEKELRGNSIKPSHAVTGAKRKESPEGSAKRKPAGYQKRINALFKIMPVIKKTAGKKYAKVFCSQCGNQFGPADAGYSSCAEHTPRKNPAKTEPALRYHVEMQTTPGTAAARWLLIGSFRTKVDAEFFIRAIHKEYPTITHRMTKS